MKSKLSDYLVLLLGGFSLTVIITVFVALYTIIEGLIKYKTPIKDLFESITTLFITGSSTDFKITIAVVILLVIGCLINPHFSVHYLRRDNPKTKLHFIGLILTLIFCLYNNYQEIKSLIDYNKRMKEYEKQYESYNNYYGESLYLNDSLKKTYYKSIAVSFLYDGIVIINILLLMSYNENEDDTIITETELAEANRLMNDPTPKSTGIISYIPVGEEGNNKPITPPMPNPVDIPESEVVVHKPEPIVTEASQELVNKIDVQPNNEPVVVMEAMQDNNVQLPPPIEESHDEAVLPTIQ